MNHTASRSRRNDVINHMILNFVEKWTHSTQPTECQFQKRYLFLLWVTEFHNVSASEPTCHLSAVTSKNMWFYQPCKLCEILGSHRSVLCDIFTHVLFGHTKKSAMCDMCTRCLCAHKQKCSMWNIHRRFLLASYQKFSVWKMHRSLLSAS